MYLKKAADHKAAAPTAAANQAIHPSLPKLKAEAPVEASQEPAAPETQAAAGQPRRAPTTTAVVAPRLAVTVQHAGDKICFFSKKHYICSLITDSIFEGPISPSLVI